MMIIAFIFTFVGGFITGAITLAILNVYYGTRNVGIDGHDLSP